MGQLADVVSGFLGVVILGLTYFGFQFQWPDSYKSLANTFQLRIQERLWRVVAFRSAPVFIVAVLIWSGSRKFGGSGWLAVFIAVAFHILTTNGKALLRSMNTHRPESVVNYGSYHVLASAVAAAAGVVGSFSAPSLRRFIPGTQTIVDSIWTALVVALLTGVVLRLTVTTDDERDASAVRYRYERAVRDAGIEVFDTIFEEAASAGTDPLLARAVAVSEILQRPAWVRRAERIKGILRPAGSYGVMQMRSPKPLTDLESIRLFCAANQGPPSFTVSDSEYAESKLNRLWFRSGRHNGDIEFIEATERSYVWFVANTEWVHLDSSFGSLGIVEKRRYPTEWGLRMATTSEVVEIRLEGGSKSTHTRPSGSAPSSWWYFEYRCSMLEEKVCFTEGGQDVQRCFPLVRNGYFV